MLNGHLTESRNLSWRTKIWRVGGQEGRVTKMGEASVYLSSGPVSLRAKARRGQSMWKATFG